MELLTNAIFDTPNAPPGWELQEFSTTFSGVADSAELAGFANQSGAQGLWLKEFAGLFIGNGNERTSAILSQSAPAVVGDTYTFSGHSLFETNYSGGVTTLDANSPSGAVPSPTNTYFRMTFLNSSGGIVGSPTTLDLRTVQTNGGGWLQSAINAVAPAGAATVRVIAAAEDMIPNIDPQQSAFFDNFSLKRSGASTAEILANNDLEISPSQVPAGWTINVENTNPSAAYFAGFAAHAGSNGWYLDNSFSDVVPQDASATQTIAGTPGATYTFSGWSQFYRGYSGATAVLDENSPFGAVPSLTTTEYQIEFLDAANAVLGSNAVELRAAGQLNDTTWRQHSVSAVAPAGTTQVRVSLKANDLMANANLGEFQGANFDDFSLTALVPGIAGDFSGDGRVDGTDLSLLLANWGATVPPTPTGWNGSAPTASGIDADELSRLLSTWGQGTSTAIPEPATAIGLVLCGALLGVRSRR
jgi:hypothetical protein